MPQKLWKTERDDLQKNHLTLEISGFAESKFRCIDLLGINNASFPTYLPNSQDIRYSSSPILFCLARNK
jgi:hypothetical protein